jgi:hypothetical protein
MSLATFAGFGNGNCLLLGELTKECFALFIKVDWRIYDHVYEKFTVVARVKARHSFSAKTQNSSVLRSGLDLDLHFTTKGGSGELRTKSGLDEGNVKFMVQIFPITFESIVWGNSKVYVELAKTTASSSRWTLVSDAHG